MRVIANTTKRDGKALERLKLAPLCGKARLAAELLEQRERFGVVQGLGGSVAQVLDPLVGSVGVLLTQVDALSRSIVDCHLPGPEKVLSPGAVDLDASNNGILALVRVDRDLGCFHDFPHDALICSIRQLDEGGDTPAGNVRPKLLLDKRLLNVRLVEPQAHRPALHLSQDTQQSSARAAGTMAVRAEALADLAVGREGNVWSHPKDIPLLPIHHGRVCHCSLETSPAAKDKASERRDVEVGAPLRVQGVGKGPAELVPARRHEIDRRLFREAMVVQDRRHLLDKILLGDGAGEEILEHVCEIDLGRVQGTVDFGGAPLLGCSGEGGSGMGGRSPDGAADPLLLDHALLALLDRSDKIIVLDAGPLEEIADPPSAARGIHSVRLGRLLPRLLALLVSAFRSEKP
mmetsp:Transcript_29115/g.71366  ORF Transcript_29115/g.71366 Transcript_29115/m.71366 type:complete len:404 (-) Transcript_29115:145-1356(-)